MALGVGLGDDGEVLARPGAGQFEGEAHDPRDAVPGEHGDFGADFFRLAAMGAPADAGIFALAVLAHDHPVEITRPDIGERTGQAREDARRPDIGILVEALADLQAQPPERYVVGNRGIADRAEKDGVEFAKSVEAVVGHHPAGLAIVVGAPGKVGRHDPEIAGPPRQRLEHPQPGRHDLGADAVARNGGNPVITHVADPPIPLCRVPEYAASPERASPRPLVNRFPS